MDKDTPVSYTEDIVKPRDVHIQRCTTLYKHLNEEQRQVFRLELQKYIEDLQSIVRTL